MQYSIEKSTLTSLADAIRDMDIRRNATTDPEIFVQHNFISQAISPTVSTIRAYAFSSCYNLEVVEFPAASYVGSHAFESCSKLSAVNLSTCTEIGESAFYFAGNSITFNLGEVTTLGDYALCGSFASIIEYGYNPWHFKVESAPALNLSNVTSLGKFALASRYVENVSLDSLTSLPDRSGWYYGDGSPFYSLYAPLSLPELTYVGQYGFEGYCRCMSSMIDIHGSTVSLFDLTLPKCSYVGSIAFSDAAIHELNLPACTDLGYAAFMWGAGTYDRTDVEIINLPVLSSVPQGAFTRCAARTLNLPGVSVISLQDAMSECWVGTVNMPNLLTWTDVAESSIAMYSRVFGQISVPACTTLSGRVYDRFNFTSGVLSLPAVTSIDYIDQRIKYNDQWGYDHGTLAWPLSSVYIGTSNCTLNSINAAAPGSSFVIPDIYVPSSYVEDYKVANNWSVYASKIFGY